MSKKNLIVGMTGASGAIFGVRVLEALRDETDARHRSAADDDAPEGVPADFAAADGGVAGGTWQQMFCAIAEQIPHAIVLVDMKVPGLPLAYVNAAFQTLIKYFCGVGQSA